MYMIDSERKQSLNALSLYLSVKEAEKVIKELQSLLKDADACDHFHVYDENKPEKEISCSIITEDKLKNLDIYNDLERRVFSE